jgi:hypothetical protein
MSLSSLIVQRQVATMRQVEEALARQVIYGGDLVTNLLEVALVDESILVELLAASLHLPPAPAGELPPAPAGSRALLPPDTAAQTISVPIEVRGDKLVLAVAEPLPPEIKEQLAYTLGMRIEERAAPAVRVWQAIAKTYGMRLERRMQRLVGRLAGEEWVGATPLAPPISTQLSTAPAPQRRSALPPSAHLPPLPGPAHSTVAGAASMQPGPRRHSTLKTFPTERPSATIVQPPPGMTPELAPTVDSPPDRPPELLQRTSIAPARPGQRHRGPLLFEDAEAEAEEATERDGLLGLAFDFARQFFEYTALFLVHGDIAEGRDGFGSGATRERVLGIGVPLDLPSLLSRAREARIPIVGSAQPDGLDAVLLGDLQRPRDVEMAVIPIVVRTRAVGLLIGDCGEAGIDRPSLRQITELCGIVSRAFERIIVRRKLDGFIAGARGGSMGRIEAGMVPSKRTGVVEPPALPTTTPPPVVASASPRAVSPSVAASASAVSPSVVASALVAPPSVIALPSMMREAEITFAREVVNHVETLPERVDEPSPDSEPETPFELRRGIRPRSSAPPAVTIATVRQISGPPIPREEPDTLPGGFGPRSYRAAIGALRSTQIGVQPVDEVALLIDRLAAGLDPKAAADLAQLPDPSFAMLMARFPGPVVLPRSRAMAMMPPPPASECGPILALVVRARRRSLPFLLGWLADPDAERRGWAAHALWEMPALEALPALRARENDPDAGVRVSAARALEAIIKAFGTAVVDALERFHPEAAPEQRAEALRAMGDAAEPATVQDLIRGLDDEEDRVSAVAHDSLVRVTLQDFGREPDPWLEWWEVNRDRHRIEWLIDSLVHHAPEIRRKAGEELRAESRQYFAYAADLPPRERERAQQRYRDWWITEGRSRHVRP